METRAGKLVDGRPSPTMTRREDERRRLQACLASMMPRRMARVRVKRSCELVALAPADGALQGGQVLGEAAEHLQHRLAVVEEDVAPHDGIGGGDAGEVAEAAGGELDHLALGRVLQVGRRADDGVGDQMRQMRGDGQHPVVMAGLHDLDLAAERASRARASRSTAAASVPGGGVRMHQRPWNSSAKPASGPECSVPATGWPGTKCTPSGMLGPRSRITACLTEPTSVTMAPGCQMVAHRRRRSRHRCRAARRARRGRRRRRRRRRLMHAVEEAELQRLVAGRLAARRAGDMAGEALALHHPGKRGADQPDADQRHAVEQRLAHRAAAPARPRLPVGVVGQRGGRRRGSPPRCRW